jgi:dephospho-CoA kinase
MVIGITGGVGCGKSTVLNILQKEYGCFVIEADKRAHLLMEPGQAVYKKIAEHFGDRILKEDKTIDRTKLGAIVFSDSSALAWLNGTVHPAVKADIREEISQIRSKEQSPVIVIEAALLIEDHYKSICDEFWYIYADVSVRMERLKKSRGYTEEKTLDIMKNQLSEAEFSKHCERKIDNSSDLENTRRQIKEIFESCGGRIWQK